MLLMNRVFQISLILLILLLLLAGETSASYWFRVIDISPISMTPNSEADFNVAVKGLGSQGEYVELVFKNKSQGLNFSCEKMIKYVFPAGVTKYNCTVTVADVAPGNYSFVVDVSARGAPSGKKTAYVEVIAAQADHAIEDRSNGARSQTSLESEQKIRTSEDNQTSAVPGSQKTPAPGAALASLAILLASWRMRK